MSVAKAFFALNSFNWPLQRHACSRLLYKSTCDTLFIQNSSTLSCKNTSMVRFKLHQRFLVFILSFVNGSKIMLKYVNYCVKNHQRLLLLLPNFTSVRSTNKTNRWCNLAAIVNYWHKSLMNLVYISISVENCWCNFAWQKKIVDIITVDDPIENRWRTSTSPKTIKSYPSISFHFGF